MRWNFIRFIRFCFHVFLRIIELVCFFMVHFLETNHIYTDDRGIIKHKEELSLC
jgi:hypothetical protein